MFQILLFYIVFSLVKSVTIEYPPNKFIEERVRKDVNSIDPLLRYYVTPHEIQFHVNAIDNSLPYFLKCKGSKKSIKFTVPKGALQYLALDTDHGTHIITAILRRNQLTSDLIGRYTCSETINSKLQETSVYVYIQDGRSVFTKKIYPTVYSQTGIHFFNIPCQTNSWYSRISCSSSSNSRQCKARQCTSQERQVNELKCNIPECPGEELCIPVYYTPSDIKAEKVLFDPQIGFALVNPTISNGLTQFTCMSNYTPSQVSKIPFDSSEPDFVQIHQPGLTIMSDEVLRLSCEIQYGTKVDRIVPKIFWFEDVHQLRTTSNRTEERVFNSQTQIYSQNSSITLEGFKPNKTYRFYCVRISDQGLYSSSIDIISANAPTLDLEINPSGSDSDNTIQYGSNAVYDITIFTIPRSSIILEMSRNSQSLNNDKRFQLLETNNRENQYFEYSLTIFDITFEDEVDLKITAKSSRLQNTSILKPVIKGNSVGELSFIPEQIPRSIPWRNENSKNKINIYSYGIFPQELYRIACTIRHHSNQKQSLNVFIQYSPCKVENCLSTLNDKTCRTSSNEQLIPTTSNRINSFETQFVSVQSHKLDDPATGHQYLCCSKNQGSNILAKAITILSNHRDMFNINKPEFSLVTNDALTYRCEGHELIYDDLKMIYNDNLFIYERNSLDNQWRIKGSRQVKRVDIQWNLPASEKIRSTAIEVKTPALKMIGNNGFLQCIGLSRRSDLIPNMNDTYIINVEDAVPLKFQNDLPAISQLDKNSNDDVKFDCQFNGRPKPKLVWLKGKLPLNLSDSILHFGENNASIFITRAQASDTGYYTCKLNNGRDVPLERSFKLRVKGTNPYSKFSRVTAIIVIISMLLFLVMLILLIIFAIKYFHMKKNVHQGIFYENQGEGTEDKTKPPMSQLTRIALPDNFASYNVIRTFLNYVNGDNLPLDREDFKELGRGQFGVVYQVRLPDVGLVAAKTLPETIRNTALRRDKRKRSIDTDENEEMISKQETRLKKAAEMLIDEIKVMHKAGKHVNIVGLKKVAYPETRFRFIFTGGPIRDEDSFYLMELCSNGSLESMLKRFIQRSPSDKPSLYQTLSQKTNSGMTVTQAYEQCTLSDDDLTLIAYQVACGVDYLNRKQIAHCDIASRNVLVTARFIMKICDFGLATWTTYKNYREQLEQNESVQLEKKNTEIATHNLTPQLARGFLRASTPDERLLLNKSSIKSDVWSFGIFLWTLFLKCRIRPFDKLLQEMEKTKSNDGESFFHRLARVISDGDVLRYIDYHPEIPRNIYAIIRDCLVEENNRPEMARIRALLCHLNTLSKQAFDYYKSEYNRYQEENATDGNVERLFETQGVSTLPKYDGEYLNNDQNPRPNDNVKFRSTTSDNTYYPEQYDDSYVISKNKNSSIQKPAPEKPPVPPRKPKRDDDAYL